MRSEVVNPQQSLSIPQFADEAAQLAASLKLLTESDIAKNMFLSPKLAASTRTLLAAWTDAPDQQRAAADSYLGDIYSGLQAQAWTKADMSYAQTNLRILSGLYGILKPLDGIYPYRLEMGYKIPRQSFKNMYDYWGDAVYKTLPTDEIILNLSAVEYSKLVTKFANTDRIVTPQFMTISSKTGEPVFVVVHAKIARGAFANWCIKNKIKDNNQLQKFNDIGYVYNTKMSQANTPVYVCEKFGGLGLSVRLS